MKFYYNDKLVRTSDHQYTHAVINTDTGKLIGCRTSEKSAQQVISSEISQYKTGILNGKAAIKAIKAGKRYYMAKSGRRTYPIPFDKTDTIEEWQNWINSREENIEYVQKNWKVVELEVR